MISNAIFLSYASQDAQAAQRICDALRAAGLEVWFDQNELRGGDAWDASIRRQIKECALFVPLISANTNARSEGYFRREWNLAVNRMLDIADDQAFLLPVVIDNTPEEAARVPDRFRERQWSNLKDGETSAELVERLKRLLAREATASPAVIPARAATAAPRHRSVSVITAAVAAVAIAGIAITVWNGRATRSTPTAPTAAVGPSPVKAEAPAPGRKSVAVLPFDNLSGRAEDVYLADGLHEEILNALARLRDLKVISRTSVMEYRGKVHNLREIGQRLGVGTLLEGSIRRDANTLRLTVQLIDSRNDRHLFAANYDRDLTKLLDLQSTVARLVAEALAATLTSVERGELDRVATNSGDAYDRYLRAVALFRRPVPKDEWGLVEPMRLLGEALKLDPNYADAHALLSQAHTWSYFHYRRPEDSVGAKRALERALALDPQLPEAQLARGLYAMYVAENLDQTLADLGAVVRTRPSFAEARSVLGYALRRRGRMDEALEHMVRAWDLDPLNESRVWGPITTLSGLRRFPEVIDQTRIFTERFPNHPDSYFVRARIESHYIQHSIEPLRAALRDHGNLLDPAGRKLIEAEIARWEGRYLDLIGLLNAIPVESPMERGAAIGFFYLAAGDARRAEQSFLRAERDALAYQQRDPGRFDASLGMEVLAMIQSMLGKHAAALATIEAARAKNPEARDATNGPRVSFVRSVVLVRAGRTEEGYAEVERLLRLPFGAPVGFIFDPPPVLLILKDDRHYDELINRPPRL